MSTSVAIKQAMCKMYLVTYALLGWSNDVIDTKVLPARVKTKSILYPPFT
jgi:hypothetical protein